MAVQVMPPSPVDKLLTMPLATVRSAVVNEVTASLNVIVTSDVSPIFKAVSDTTKVAVGLTVSTA